MIHDVLVITDYVEEQRGGAVPSKLDLPAASVAALVQHVRALEARVTNLEARLRELEEPLQ